MHVAVAILLGFRGLEPNILASPASAAEQAFHSTYVRFSLLALSSIFFLVDPFAAIPSFIAITSGIEPKRRRRMAWKAALTCCIVLTAFALAGTFLVLKIHGANLTDTLNNNPEGRMRLIFRR